MSGTQSWGVALGARESELPRLWGEGAGVLIHHFPLDLGKRQLLWGGVYFRSF